MTILSRRNTTLAVLVLAAACGGDGRTTLIVYSPHGKDLLQYYEQGFEAEHPSVDVQWVDMGSQDVLDRVRSEQQNPQADVWFRAPAETFNHAAEEGLLDAYAPTWASKVAMEAHHPDDFWYGTYLTPEVIAYNSDAVTEAEAPHDWDEVLEPQWKGKVVIRDPIASGSMRAIFGAMMVRSMRETGSPEQGYEWLRRLDANTREYVLNPTILYQKLGRREGVISLWDMPDIAVLQERTKIPVTYAIPTSGTPLLVDAIAIVHGTEHADVARQFYEFVTSAPALQQAAVKFLRIPARSDIPSDSLPQWIRDAELKIKPMPMDQKLLADSLNAWMTYWDAHIRNCCRER